VKIPFRVILDNDPIRNALDQRPNRARARNEAHPTTSLG
jgi:hypothetical protein